MKKFTWLLVLLISTFLAQNGRGQSYCIPTYTYGTYDGDYVGRVNLLNLDNITTAATAPYYTFFENVPIPEIVQGQTYTLTVCAGSYGTNNIAAWIDFDNDLEFDASEKIGQQGLGSYPQTANFVFTVPVLATQISFYTRMRVREVWNNTNIQPCDNGGYGETEDYLVAISSNLVPCTPGYVYGCGSGDGLRYVGLNTISNASGCGTNGYTEFTSLSTNLDLGVPYPLLLQSGYDYQYVSGWVDFNHNNVFETSEIVLSDFFLEDAWVIDQASIILPASTVPGTYILRLRTNFYYASSDPCAMYDFGEIEDYTIVAIPPPFCSPNSTSELEACGQDANGGCNMTIPAYQSIVPGVTYCGTTWYDGSIRDTDWYTFTVTTPSEVTFTGNNQFDGYYLLLVDGCPANNSLTVGYFDPNVPFSLTYSLQPGNYVFWVGPEFVNNVICGSMNAYYFSYTTEPWCPADAYFTYSNDGQGNWQFDIPSNPLQNGLAVEWTLSDGTSATTFSNLDPLILNNLPEASYTLEAYVYGQNECDDSYSVQFYAWPPCVADAEFTTTYLGNNTFQFDLLTPLPAGYLVDWDFGDGSTPVFDVSSVIHTFSPGQNLYVYAEMWQAGNYPGCSSYYSTYLNTDNCYADAYFNTYDLGYGNWEFYLPSQPFGNGYLVDWTLSDGVNQWMYLDYNDLYVSNLAPGTYTIQALVWQPQTYCNDLYSASFTVWPPCIADADFTTTYLGNNTFQFDLITPLPVGYWLNWYFGDGSPTVYDVSSVIHTFSPGQNVYVSAEMWEPGNYYSCNDYYQVYLNTDNCYADAYFVAYDLGYGNWEFYLPSQPYGNGYWVDWTLSDGVNQWMSYDDNDLFVNNLAPGYYTMQAYVWQFQTNCYDVFSVSFTVWPPCVANAEFTTTYLGNNTYQFDLITPLPPGYLVNWYFGDGSPAVFDLSTVIHTYSPGLNVYVEAEMWESGNYYGCSDYYYIYLNTDNCYADAYFAAYDLGYGNWEFYLPSQPYGNGYWVDWTLSDGVNQWMAYDDNDLFVNNLAPGNYTMQAYVWQSQTNCFDVYSVSFTVWPPCVANAEFTTTYLGNNTFQFDLITPLPAGYLVNWYFGDGSPTVFDVSSVIHTYSPGLNVYVEAEMWESGNYYGCNDYYYTNLNTSNCYADAHFTWESQGANTVEFALDSPMFPTYWVDWNFGDGSPILWDVNEPVHTYAAPGIYLVSVLIWNPLDSTCYDSFETLVTANEYCIPYFTYGCDFGDGLTYVELNTIVNQTGCSTNGYGDYTALSTTLNPGTPYNLALASGYANNYAHAWIDFDDDGAFESDENVLSGFLLGAANVISVTSITIPNGVPLGSHRMRIMGVYNQVSVDPCGSYNYGEVEDYTIVVSYSTCPNDATPEQEPCLSDLNGGCNMTVPAYQSIVPGETVCGTTYYDGSIRDTDWYTFTITAPVEVSFTINSQFSGYSLLLNEGCSSGYELTVEYFSPNIPAELTYTLYPGSYVFWIGPEFGSIVNCGSNNIYNFTFTTENWCGANAEFVWASTGGNMVDFSLISPMTPDYQVSWNFGDGSPAVLDFDDYTYAYSSPGTYLVSALVTSLADLTCYDYFEQYVTASQYCTPFFSYGCGDGDGLTYVELNTIVNQSGCSPNAYGDYTALSTTLNAGATYNLILASGYANNYASAWIDFDDDGLFEADEQILDGYWLEMANVSQSVTITIPSGVLPGPHRLRIIALYNDVVVDPCETQVYGEVEDYTIVVAYPFCPYYATPELEPCEADLNGGCNMDIPAYQPIISGQTICGVSWYDGTIRDTDWFSFVLSATSQVSISGLAQFNGSAILVDYSDCLSPAVLGSVEFVDGIPNDGSLTLPPGSYALVIVPLFSEPAFYCDQYFFTLEVDANVCLANAGFTWANIGGNTVELALDMPMNPPYLIDWSFGDGAFVFDQNTPSHTYSNSGTYLVSASVWDPLNSLCFDYYQEYVTVSLYCQPSFSYGCGDGDGLVYVELNTIMNQSGCSPNAYGNYTALSTQLAAGSTYDLGLASGFASNFASAWIDFDDDGAFESDEMILSGLALPAANQTLLTPITIPANAPLGAHTMRIIAAYQTVVTDPCQALVYGEVEDYTVVIVNPCVLSAEFLYSETGWAQYHFSALYPFPSSQYLLTWDFGDGTVLTGSDQEMHQYAGPGVYEVSLLVQNLQDPCTYSFTITIQVGPPPCQASADFSYTLVQGTTVAFSTLLPVNLQEYLIEWNFGDGGSTTGSPNPSHTYATPGTYTVSCFVQSILYPNCTDYFELSLTIEWPSPNWNYTVTSGNHTILVPQNAQVTIDGVPVVAGDFLGLFYHDQNNNLACGGYGMYDGNALAIAAWGDDATTSSIKEGFADGELFIWKIWKASTNTEYQATAVYQPLSAGFTHTNAFAVNGLSGIQSLIYVSYVTQNITLNQNWNLFSTYIIPINPAIATVLTPIAGQFVIVKNGAGAVYWPQFSVNGIGNMVLGQGYQIKMNMTQVLPVTGTMANAPSVAINIPANWSFLGYLYPANHTIVSMLAPIYGSFVIVKNSSGLVYWPQFNVNSIVNMIPGQGYQIKMTTAMVFHYPSAGAVAKEYFSESNPTHFGAVLQTGSNMTLGIPTEAWPFIAETGDELGVFDSDGRLVGSGIFQGANLAVSIWGDDLYSSERDGIVTGTPFTLRVWSNRQQVEMSMEVTRWKEGSGVFLENGISVVDRMTLISEPLPVALGQNYPNPFANTTTISINLPEDMDIELSLYNALGEKLSTLARGPFQSGSHDFVVDGSTLSAGIYHYRLTAGSIVLSRTLNVLK